MSDSDGGITVRDMRRDDVPEILRLIQELATFEGVPCGPKLTEQDLTTDGFSGAQPWYFGLVAEREGTSGLVGHVLCNRAYSSWTGRAYYLEDLYVVPAERRSGVGRRLLRALCRRAVAEGVHRVDWHVLADNTSALAFYARLGARDVLASEGRTAMRLDRPYIETVADADTDADADPHTTQIR